MLTQHCLLLPGLTECHHHPPLQLVATWRQTYTCSDSELMSNNTTVNILTSRTLRPGGLCQLLVLLSVSVQGNYCMNPTYLQHHRDTGDNPFSCVSLLKGSHCKLSFITKTSRSSTLRRCQQCTVCRHVYDSHGRYFSDAVCFHQLYLRMYVYGLHPPNIFAQLP